MLKITEVGKYFFAGLGIGAGGVGSFIVLLLLIYDPWPTTGPWLAFVCMIPVAVLVMGIAFLNHLISTANK